VDNSLYLNKSLVSKIRVSAQHTALISFSVIALSNRDQKAFCT
jgi:hypothetical protein